MCRKCVTLLTLAAFLNLSFGCTHTVKVRPGQIHKEGERIIKVALLDGTVIEFDEAGGWYDYMTNRIDGVPKVDTKPTGADTLPMAPKNVISVSADSVVTAWVKRVSKAGTVAVIALSAAVVAVIIIAASEDEPPPPPPPSGGTESCPFVYSFDGTDYIFDAEPLGGAICQALQRTDYSRLEYLKPVDGKYRIKLTNEMPESQYLDQVQLIAVDHPAGQKVVPDTAGNVHLITHAYPPQRARDERFNDVLPFVSIDDGISWQSQMTPDALNASMDSRHHLLIEFPKPPAAKTAYLTINAGTALWGSHMIREMLEARGGSIDQWYKSVNSHGDEFWKLLSFTFQEELYIMKLYVQTDEESVERGLVFGGGPYVTEDRLINFDVSDISGNHVTLNLNPPKGFWSIDYLAIQYDTDSVLPQRRCTLETARDQRHESVKENLSTVDNVYCSMSNVGDWVDMEFTALSQPRGIEQSMFLKTTGYYKLHTDTTKLERKELIDSVMRTPGAIADYSKESYLDKYRKLQNMRAKYLAP